VSGELDLKRKESQLLQFKTDRHLKHILTTICNDYVNQNCRFYPDANIRDIFAILSFPLIFPETAAVLERLLALSWSKCVVITGNSNDNKEQLTTVLQMPSRLGSIIPDSGL